MSEDIKKLMEQTKDLVKKWSCVLDSTGSNGCKAILLESQETPFYDPSEPWIQHDREDLIPLLDEIGKVIYTSMPVCVVNWETGQAFPAPPDIREHECYTVRGEKFEDIKTAVEFVEKNKHQIVVYDFTTPPWIETKEWSLKHRKPFLSYATKKGATLIR
jgi:hypothetical protein